MVLVYPELTGVFAAAAVSFALAAPAAADGWESYVPRTLQSVIEANAGEESAEDGNLFTASNFPTRAKVVYQGEIRPIPPSQLSFLAKYLGEVRKHPEWVSLYTDEVLCRERDVDYWLPIQSPVLAHFKDEVVPGALVEIYVTWLGTQTIEGHVDWIFTINEFEVVVDQEP